jgi:DNA-binding MarR family transcriptional regulator
MSHEHEKSEGDRTAQAEQAYEALKKFRLLFKAVQRHSQWVETQCGVSSAQLWALWQLSETPGIRVSDLAKALSIHQSTASNLLDKLERSGLIRRDRSGSDQRVVRLYLTDQGKAVLKRAPEPARGLLQNALFDLPADVLASLNHNLGILVRRMKIGDEQAAMEPLSS